MKHFLVFVSALMMAACNPQGIEIEHPWARATAPGSTVASVYLQIKAPQADELVAVSTPLAERVEIHRSSEAHGTMKMRPVATVALPAGKPVKFEANGLHLMLIGLRAPLSVGQTVPLTFEFRSAASRSIDAAVVAPGDDHHAH
jgi:copper(I)-binding protein